jgi:hypothetical protein
LNLEASEINNKMDQLSPPARFGKDYYSTLAAPSSIRVFLHTKATELEPNPRSSVQKVRVAALTGNIFFGCTDRSRSGNWRNRPPRREKKISSAAFYG